MCAAWCAVGAGLVCACKAGSVAALQPHSYSAAPLGKETFKAVEGGFGCALNLVKHIRCRRSEHLYMYCPVGLLTAAEHCMLLCAWCPAELACTCSRKQHGEHFGITVSGYPEAHPDVITDNQDEQIKAYHKDIDYLKQKVPQCYRSQPHKLKEAC